MTYTVERNIVVPDSYSQKQSGYVAPFRQVHLHSTANPSAPLDNEVAYLSRNYPNGNYTHLVGDSGRVIQVAEVGQGAWDVGGDWNCETYAAIEFGERVTSQADFDKSYIVYIELARDLAKQAGIPLTLDTPDIAGIKTHNYVSRSGHGSDHTDPVAFLAMWGVSYDKLKRDIENGLSSEKPEEKIKTKKGELMLLFKETDGKIYFLIGNTYTYVGNPKELDKIKIMMNKAGYDTWEHTDPDQIKYLKRLAKKV